MTAEWRSDRGCLELLERGGPFSARSFRDVLSATDGWHDASYGGVSTHGTRAAIALAVRGARAQSMPYGYGSVVADARLGADDVRRFLDAARREAGVGVARLWSLDAFEGSGVSAGERVAMSSVIVFDGRPPTAGYAKKARQSMRRAERAGGSVEASSDPEPFLGLYARASANWAMRYPYELIRGLAEVGLVRFFDASLGGTVVASAVALLGASHWLYWLSAQDDEARGAEVGYLTVAALIEAAHAAQVEGVNLGASEGLPGVAAFKRRFGGVEVPVRSLRSASPAGAASESLAAATARARRLAGGLRALRRPPGGAEGAFAAASDETFTTMGRGGDESRLRADKGPSR